MKNTVSIDVGSHSIKVVEGRQEHGSVVVDKAFSYPTPPHSFQDGKLIEFVPFKETLYSMLLQKEIKAKNMIFTIESTSIITREITVPAVKASELETLVLYEIEQYLPIVLDEYVIEYKIIEKVKEADGEKLRVLVVALPRSIAETYFNLVKEMKFKPTALDVHSNSVSKLFNTEITINKQTNKNNRQNYSLGNSVAVLDLGHEFLNVNIIAKGVTQFSRLINLGGKDLNSTIASVFNLSLTEATEKKHHIPDLSKKQEGDDLSILLNEKIQQSIDQWIQEVQRIFQYYTSRSVNNKIDCIYLYGGSSSLNGLDEYLRIGLNLPVYTIQKMSNVVLGEQMRDIDLPYYLNAIGAIIRN